MLCRRCCDVREILDLIPSFSDFRYPYTEVFPRAGHWSHLFDLRIEGLATGGRQFIGLLQKGLPMLKVLTLANVELTDGSWEAVLQEMRMYLELKFLHLGSRTQALRQRVGIPFRTANLDSEDSNPEFLCQHAECIVFCGRHLCLPARLPDVDAAHSLQTFFPSRTMKFN